MNFCLLVYFHLARCVSTSIASKPAPPPSPPRGTFADDHYHRVQVNIAAESGEMGILAQHVPSIEQLKPVWSRSLRKAVETSNSSVRYVLTIYEGSGRAWY